MTLHSTPSRLAVALLCTALGACVNQQVELAGDDTDTFFGGLRGSWELGSPAISDGRPPARQAFVELDLATSSSDFDQTVLPGTVVQVGGADFDGPATVHADFDLCVATLDARLRLRSETGAGLDFLAGLGFATLDLDVSDPGTSASDSQDGIGPHLGTGVFYELPSRLRLFVEGSVLLPFVDGGESLADVETFDAGLSLRLSEGLELIASWRHLEYEYEGDLGQSDYDLGASGPRLTLELRF